MSTTGAGNRHSQSNDAKLLKNQRYTACRMAAAGFMAIAFSTMKIIFLAMFYLYL
ncbi:hypothetical protein CAter282_3361 [Collimonas arenae]|uniref:Uncharacterized protein n=1 Tax=Collimonas arenae TaxID=279058 RepID=A0A127PTK7_9BURK|nr:hypothetical protein [Collimonas arenae]AMP01160.1 hypothetical protein CAter10_3685 [Collimonas arenae]AMP11054.1 hypothetical protein CAter282_3361 [Collimonas arenae]